MPLRRRFPFRLAVSQLLFGQAQFQDALGDVDDAGVDDAMEDEDW